MCLVSFRIRLGKYKKIEKLGSIYIECPGRNKKTEHALQHKPNKMSTTQMTFTAEQIGFLREWFNTQSRQYVNTVMDDDFEGDEENFQKLCETTFNTDGFKVGKMKSDDKSVKEKTGKRTRKAKDPAAPKRPKSAYMCWLWSDEGVAKVKSENKEIAHKDAVKRASEVWASMSDSEKAPWEKKSLDSKKEYEEKMKDYTPNSDVEEDNADVSNLQVPEGWQSKKGMYLGGYSKVGNTKYTTLLDAITAMNDCDDAGGIVYDGKHFTIRKIGTPRLSKKGETLITPN